MRVAQHERGTWEWGGHQGLISFKIENNSRHLDGAYFIPDIVSSNFYVFLRVWALSHSVLLCLKQHQDCHTLSLQYTI